MSDSVSAKRGRRLNAVDKSPFAKVVFSAVAVYKEVGNQASSGRLLRRQRGGQQCGSEDCLRQRSRQPRR